MKHLKILTKIITIYHLEDLLSKDSNIGKYELYVDGSTGWGIIFANGY
jgi:hypothetical protein